MGIVSGRRAHEPKIHIELAFAIWCVDGRKPCRSLLDRGVFLVVDVVERVIPEISRDASDTTW